MQFGIHIYYFFVKIYVGFVADIDIKILGVPLPSPFGPGMPFIDSDKCTKEGGGGGRYLFLPGFFSLYDAIQK